VKQPFRKRCLDAVGLETGGERYCLQGTKHGGEGRRKLKKSRVVVNIEVLWRGWARKSEWKLGDNVDGSEHRE